MGGREERARGHHGERVEGGDHRAGGKPHGRIREPEQFEGMTVAVGEEQHDAGAQEDADGDGVADGLEGVVDEEFAVVKDFEANAGRQATVVEWLSAERTASGEVYVEPLPAVLKAAGVGPNMVNAGTEPDDHDQRACHNLRVPERRSLPWDQLIAAASILPGQ